MRSAAVTVAVLYLSLSSDGYALTRDDIMSTAEEYAAHGYYVEPANVYPTNASGCYAPGMENTVDLGWCEGEAYSYGRWDKPTGFLEHLLAGRGAGNDDDMRACCENCVWHHMTGIDCSGFVGRTWGMISESLADKPGTSTLVGLSTQIDTSALRAGDVLNKPGSHVYLFDTWVPGQWPYAYVYHSYLDGVTEKGWVDDAIIHVPSARAAGYIPRVYHALVDSPAASLLVVGSDSSGRVEWETGWERNTEGFVVYRKSPGGGREPISNLIPATGSVERGARYSFTDGGYSGPQTVYRLQEVETSGNTLWLGKTSAADGLPFVRQEEPPRLSVWQRTSSKTEVCSITEFPENWNFEWLAICPDEWVDELAPLVAYRQSQGLQSGTWTFNELESCTMSKPTRGDIQDLLAWALNEWTVKPKYLLLVGDAYYEGGDADLIPMWASYEPELAWFDEDSTWSDRPYADPDEDGEVEVFVGRVPAMSATDVANVVAKIIERENSADPTYGRRSLLFVEDSGDCGNDSAWIRQLADSVNSCLPANWSRTLIAQSAIGGTFSDWERVADSAWSAGQGLVLFFGNCSGWWDFNNFMNVGGDWNAGKLLPNHKYPFVFGGSCGEGGTDRENSYGRAVLEQLLCSYPDRGAAGGLLPSRAMHSHTAKRLFHHVSDRIFRGEPTLGAAVYHGMDDLLEVFSGGADHVWEYVFFGDPAMRSLAPDMSGVAEGAGHEMFAFGLEAPMPHPISARGAIRFSIPAAAEVDLKVYELSGRVVRTLASGLCEAGQHSVEWDGTNERGRQVASGVYFLRLRSGDREAARKVTVFR